MQRNKLLPVIVAAVNVIGIICLVYFGVIYLSHDTFVSNPDAMLPLTRWEGAGIMLTIGFFPLAIANIIAFAVVGTEKLRASVRLMYFIPSLICMALAASFWLPAIFELFQK